MMSFVSFTSRLNAFYVLCFMQSTLNCLVAERCYCIQLNFPFLSAEFIVCVALISRSTKYIILFSFFPFLHTDCSKMLPGKPDSVLVQRHVRICVLTGFQRLLSDIIAIIAYLLPGMISLYLLSHSICAPSFL